METAAEKRLKRFERAKKRKWLWEDLYEDCQQYAAPHREIFDEDVDFKGEHKDGKGLVFDSTAIDAVQKFTSNLQSSLVPPARSWIDLLPGTQLQDQAQAKEALNKITDIMFSHLKNSNFDTQIAECFQDLAIGTGALLALEGTQTAPFNFISVPLSQLFLEEGPEGRIETAFRCWKVAARNIEGTWPDAKISKELREIIEEQPDKELEIVEMTTPKKGITITTPQGQQTIDGYEYSVTMKNMKATIVEREQRSSPWIIFRWSTLPGEIYGRGPVTFALPDIKTLNKTKELLLKSASIAIFGMWTAVDDGTINLENIKFGSGSVIPVANNEGSINGPTLKALDPPGDVNLSQIIIQDLKASINNQLFADPLGPIDLPVKSATEMSLRQQELAKRIGSAFGRLQFELIQPLINRLLDILDSLGLVDIGDLRVDGGAIAIQHQSPLARAQGEEEAMALIRLMETIVTMYGPEALNAACPLDKVLPILTTLSGAPEKAVSTSQEIQQMQQAAAQAMAMQQQQGPPNA